MMGDEKTADEAGQASSHPYNTQRARAMPLTISGEEICVLLRQVRDAPAIGGGETARRSQTEFSAPFDML